MTGSRFDAAVFRAEQWGCTRDGEAIETDAALLWPVVRNGERLMLKIVDPEGDEAGAAAFLAAMAGRGAVRLLHAAEDALLIERVQPRGRSLEAMALDGDDKAAMSVLCDIAGRVRSLDPAQVTGLIPMDRRIDGLWRSDLPIAAWARDWAAGMLGSRTGWVLLHGDLHHFNVLRGERGWLMIDPKGLVGPAPYDLANAVLNPFPHGALVMEPDRMAQMAAVAAESLGIPVREMLRWVCLHGCLAAAWDGSEGYWARGARIAGRLAGMDPPDD